LLEEYPVLKERDREFVAQFKFTVLLLPGGTKKITGLPLGDIEKKVASSHSVKDDSNATIAADVFGLCHNPSWVAAAPAPIAQPQRSILQLAGVPRS